MGKNVSIRELEPLINDVLEKDSYVTIPVRGNSMKPLFTEKDAVALKKCGRAPAKGDIVFYKRQNGAFVLHRVTEKKENGYILCGDNCLLKEYGVKDSQIIAKLYYLEKGGRKYYADGVFLKFFRLILPFYRLFNRLRISVRVRKNNNDRDVFQ